MLTHSKRGRARAGTTIVEFAIVISACLMFLLGIFEYGRFIMIRQVLDNAAREGVRQAISGTATLTTSDIQATVTNFLAGQPVSNLNIQVYLSDSTGNNVGSWNNATFGQPIAVQVTGTYAPILPGLGFLLNPTNLSAMSIMRSESNQ
jgi:Flp pilus assembly protein TadG